MLEADDFPNELLKKKLANLPNAPGIYQFKGESGKIIYIGKAKSLRNRVRSYFQDTRTKDAKTTALITKIEDLEVIVVNSEAEALILEDSLIKQHKPRYNIMLRDDKTYPFVRITNEEFPRIFKTRTVIKDGSKYFGPYTDVKRLNALLKLLRNILKFRSCKYNLNTYEIQNRKFKLCLDYHIGKCSAPCIGKIDKQDYQSNIKMAASLLQGKSKEIKEMIIQQMNQFAEEMNFEEAALLRDKLYILNEFLDSQKIVSSEFNDRDVIGFVQLENYACSLIFMIREGKIVGKKHYIINNTQQKSKEEILQKTIETWYLAAELIPEEILIEQIPEDSDFIIQWLKQKRGRTVSLNIPKQGEKKKLLDLANINAEYMLREHLIAITKKEIVASKPIVALQKDLNLPKPPIRIECFDNSHIQGSDYVSSLVCFIDGKPKKSEYRRYKLAEVEGNDDFAAMREVIFRRYSHAVSDNSPLPDLIIIDGGKGQLSSAVEILKSIGVYDKVTVIGLAKRLEEVFFPNQKDAILLPKASISLKLIQKLRDEAHRFAITYHRLLRDKRTLQTELTEIEGIGEATAQKLLIKFGSIKKIKQQNIDTLSEIVNLKVANNIIKHFADKSQNETENKEEQNG